MADKPKPSARPPTPSTLWKDLVAAEAAQPPSPIDPSAAAVIAELIDHETITFSGFKERRVIFYREDIYEKGILQAYRRGKEFGEVSKWFNAGFCVFIGIIGGLLVAAILQGLL